MKFQYKFHNSYEIDEYILKHTDVFDLSEKIRIFNYNFDCMKSQYFKDCCDDPIFNVALIETSAYTISPYNLIEALSLKKIEEIYNISPNSFFKIMQKITPWIMNDKKFVNLNELFTIMNDPMFSYVLNCFNGEDVSNSISYRYYDLRYETVSSIISIFNRLSSIFPNCDFELPRISALVNHNYLTDNELKNVVDIICNNPPYQDLGLILVEHNLQLKDHPAQLKQMAENELFAKKMLMGECPCANFLNFETLKTIYNTLITKKDNLLVQLSNCLLMINNHSNKDQWLFERLYKILTNYEAHKTFNNQQKDNLIGILSEKSMNCSDSKINTVLKKLNLIDIDPLSNNIQYIVNLFASSVNLDEISLSDFYYNHYSNMKNEYNKQNSGQAEYGMLLSFFHCFINNDNSPSLILHSLVKDASNLSFPSYIIDDLKKHKNYNQVANNILYKLKNQ